jgi:hypothetical protein
MIKSHKNIVHFLPNWDFLTERDEIEQQRDFFEVSSRSKMGLNGMRIVKKSVSLMLDCSCLVSVVFQPSLDDKRPLEASDCHATVALT